MVLSTVSYPMKPAACACLNAQKMKSEVHKIIHPKLLSACAKRGKLRCHGGLHTVGACHKCQQGVKNNVIPKIMAWKAPACKIYMFTAHEDQYTQLGTED